MDRYITLHKRRSKYTEGHKKFTKLLQEVHKKCTKLKQKKTEKVKTSSQSVYKALTKYLIGAQ